MTFKINLSGLGRSPAADAPAEPSQYDCTPQQLDFESDSDGFEPTEPEPEPTALESVHLGEERLAEMLKLRVIPVWMWPALEQGLWDLSLAVESLSVCACALRRKCAVPAARRLSI